MEILRFPHQILLRPCSPIEVFDDALRLTLAEMWETMLKAEGMGLAANQVGISKRMFCLLGPNNEKLFIINPKIVAVSSMMANLEEACLSAPGERLIVPDRPIWTLLEFHDEFGHKQKRLFQGIYSVACQHEFQHLLGLSFLQSKSIPRDKRKTLARKWNLRDT